MGLRVGCFAVALLGLVCAGRAEPPSRAEAVAIAKTYADHRWSATDRNVKHGPDRSGVEVNTPDTSARVAGRALWSVGTNVGVPYKWGGFDSLESFERGVSAGKSAGDLYSPEKRRKGGAAVSPYAVGIDCSGFISRCWRLLRKHSTYSLVSLCRALDSAQELKPGDIMNTQGGHVRLFARWLDDLKVRAVFYEAEPYSKVIAAEYDVSEMTAQGYLPYRYKQIKD